MVAFWAKPAFLGGADVVGDTPSPSPLADDADVGAGIEPADSLVELSGGMVARRRRAPAGFSGAGAGRLVSVLRGMYLNDAFDEEFDRAKRRERPLPSGQIEVAAVWRWGFGWLGCGLLSLAFLGWWPALLGVLLAGAILLYDAVHKLVAFAPVLMAGCRVLLIWVAAASAVGGHHRPGLVEQSGAGNLCDRAECVCGSRAQQTRAPLLAGWG